MVIVVYLSFKSEDMYYISEKFLDFLEQAGIDGVYSHLIHKLVAIAVILLLAYLLGGICRRVMVPAVKKITNKTNIPWDDHLFNDKILSIICRLVPPVVIAALLPLAFSYNPNLLDFLEDICSIYITVVTIWLVCEIINSVYTISSSHERLKNHSLKGFYQMLKLVVVSVGAIIIISTLIDKNPLAILTGLGAGTAILMLVFQDTIKGLVAGVQLTANDMLRPGDWISMPKYGADGTVLEVTLTTIKVQNWDMTITTVPPFALVNDSFQNWRGMFNSGGRRIKRSLNIDMHSVGFANKELMESFSGEPWMANVEGDEVVNLTLFRSYLDHYLRTNPKVSKEHTLMVRQLQPTAEGLPLELYFFSANTAWVKYEEFQSEIFEHILAVLPRFGLRVFQSPTGLDFTRFNGNIS